MTKKETLANEYIALKKQFDGEYFNANLTKHQIWWLVRTFKVTDLEDKIEAVKNAIRQKELRRKREAWFETEEGKAFKENNVAKRKAIYQKENALRKETHEMVNAFVKELLGDDFAVTAFCFGNFCVSLVKRINEDGVAEGLFGHEFTVYFGKSCFSGEFNWELNYGTLGSFKLGEDEKRTKYLMGLATFANSEKVNSELKQKLIIAEGTYNKLREIRNKLEIELEEAGND